MYFTDSTAARRTIATVTTLGSYLPLAGGTMTGAAVASAGTAAAPSVGVGANTLGLFNGGTNILGLSTAGTERMRINASGNVGIGTTAPAYALDVNTDVMVRSSLYISSSSNYIRNPSNELVFGTNATDRMRIDSGGHVFLGGGSAAVNILDVNGAMAIGSSYAAVNTAPANGLLVQGNVGIGTTAPTSTLTVNGSLARNLVTVTAATYTVAATDTHLIANFAGTVTLTLPAAASFPGREISIRTITANTVVSASSNVVPLAGGAAGTAILSATAGKWVMLVSDGTNWQIQMGN